MDATKRSISTGAGEGGGGGVRVLAPLAHERVMGGVKPYKSRGGRLPEFRVYSSLTRQTDQDSPISQDSPICLVGCLFTGIGEGSKQLLFCFFVLSAVTPDAKQTNGGAETDWSARTWMAFTMQRLSVALHCSTRTRNSAGQAVLLFNCIIRGETGYTHSLSPSRPPNNTLSTH